MKRLLLASISAVALVWRFVPSYLRRNFFFFCFVLESRGTRHREGIARLFAIEDDLSKVINERALALGGGEHPKHRLVPYHDFFIDNLRDCESVIDVGCGYGAVARSIAMALPAATVLGIDNHAGRLNQALQASSPKNLEFLQIDINDFQPHRTFDAVILSNVLEHIHDRVSALQNIVKITQARKFLIRVPLFERHWSIALRRELNINYYQDDDHKIEHTISEFYSEVQAAGLKVKSMKTLWGEIWSVCSYEAK